MNVKTKNISGPTWQNMLARQINKKMELYKEDDFKVAYVVMPKDYKFEFPNVTEQPESEKKQAKDAETEVETTKRIYMKNAKGAKRGIPSFFGI